MGIRTSSCLNRKTEWRGRFCLLINNLFIFHWRMITLQYWDGFCQTSTQISHRHPRVPAPLNPCSHLPPHPIHLGCPRAQALGSCVIHQASTGSLFYIWQCIRFSAIVLNHSNLLLLPLSPKVSLYICESKKWKCSSDVPDSLRPHGLHSPWNCPGQNTGVDCFSLLQGIFPTRDRTYVSHIAGRFFTSWATREALMSVKGKILRMKKI